MILHNNIKHITRNVVLPMTLVLFYACTPVPENTLLQELSETTPNLELNEAQYVFIRNSARIIRLSAETTELFTDNQMQEFTNIAFLEVDRNNNTLNSGSADRAIYVSDSGDFELFGSVVFQSIEQNATFEASYILWSEEEQKLFGREEDVVAVTRPSGTRVEGYNLVADLTNRIIEFDNGSGVISPKDTIRNNGQEQEGPASTEPGEDIAEAQL